MYNLKNKEFVSITAGSGCECWQRSGKPINIIPANQRSEASMPSLSCFGSCCIPKQKNIQLEEHQHSKAKSKEECAKVCCNNFYEHYDYYSQAKLVWFNYDGQKYGCF